MMMLYNVVVLLGLLGVRPVRGYMADYVMKEDLLALPERCIAEDDRVVRGDRVTIAYKGQIKGTDTVFESASPEDPLVFVTGQGEGPTEGLDFGVQGMCQGEKRKITVLPEMGYRNEAHGEVPANSTLVYTVELLSIRYAVVLELMFDNQDRNQDLYLSMEEIALSAEQAARGSPPEKFEERRLHRINSMLEHDKNKDGVVALEEYVINQRLKNIQMDKEMVERREAMKAEREKEKQEKQEL